MGTKLPIVAGDKVRRALQRAGFIVIRVRGSAHFMEHPDGRRTTVHIHSGQTLKRGTLSAILDDVGMTADELRELF